METPKITVQDAAASLAAVKDSRRRARRAGYPVWFWLATGVGLAAIPLWIGKDWLPGRWESVISLVSVAVLIGAALAVSVPGVRRVRETGRPRGARWRETLRAAWPLLPVAAVMLAGGVTWTNGLWAAPLAPLVTAVAVFVVWVGCGLASTTFSAR
ncbi:MAG: hypothetical protein WCA46_12750 [Actinocatenispora sp.]